MIHTQHLRDETASLHGKNLLRAACTLLVPSLMALLAACSGGSGSSKDGGTTATEATLQSIAVNPANPSLVVGLTKQMTATGTYSDHTSHDITGSVTWKSATTSVATVDASGLVTAVAAGTSVITATSGGVSSNTTVNVTSVALQSIAVTPASPSLAVGATQQMKATGTYADGTTQDLTSSVTWKSATTTVATVSASGLATAVAAGTAVISANLGDVSGNTTLTVTAGTSGPTLVSIAVTPANPSVPLGGMLQMKATGTYSDGSTQDITKSAYWDTRDYTILRVPPYNGIVTALAVGTGVVTATIDGTVKGGTTVTVTSAGLQSIAVTPANPTLYQFAPTQLTATGTNSDGSTQDLTSSATWSSDTPSVATVSTAGVVTGVGSGSAVITASSGTVSGNTKATVVALQSMAVTPANPTVDGAGTQLTATGSFADGSMHDVTGGVTWSSGNTAVATVSAAGVVTGVSTGTAVITATGGTSSASTTVTVGSTYTIGGTVLGLAAGNSLVLQNNGKDNLTITGNGPFAFVTPLVAKAKYLVTIQTLPSSQRCSITYSSGTVSANVSTISVICGAPVMGSWSATGSLTTARAEFTATLLPSGKVLVAGGTNSSSTQAELYDPATGTWSITGSMATSRGGHTATLLPNGKVLVAGGADNGSTQAELYDPATGTWSPGGTMGWQEAFSTATLLPNGKVLVAGGGGPWAWGMGAAPGAELPSVSLTRIRSQRCGRRTPTQSNSEPMPWPCVSGATGPFGRWPSTWA